MTHIPQYLKDYPNMHAALPFYLNIHRLERGYPAHRHDFLEFSYVLAGSGAEALNGVRHAMKPGTFTFVLPYQVHELFTDPGSTLVLYNCNFSMDLLMEPDSSFGLNDLLVESEPIPAFTYFDSAESEAATSILEEMMKELQAENRWKNSLLQVKVKELLIKFDRERRKRSGRSASQDEHGADETSIAVPGLVWPMIYYIHSHYQDDLSLAKLSREFSLSASRISEVIKQTTGQTFVHFLHDLRLRHAKSLLVSTEMSVIEIAHEVGYSSYKTFSRLCKASIGMLPTEYRKFKSRAH